MTTEELKHSMYYDLACLKGQKKHPKLLARFESHLEAYLEGLRQDHAALVEALQSNVVLYQDAYEQQKTLTRNACVFDRERYDELYQLRNDVQQVRHERDETYEQLQEATAKLASGSKSIRALLRVIKAQQKACARSQRGMDEGIVICTRLKSELAAQAQDHHRQIMQAEAISDERWELLEAKQKLIVSQRNRIEQLESDLLLSKKPARMSNFWRFLSPKYAKAQPLPKKTH